MFGALKTWGCGWKADERHEWVGHICGTCVALGSHCGQSARLTTNYDAALVLAFCEAQSAEPLPRKAHFCPLRGFSTADVVVPEAPAARYAATLSTLMAATKIEDHVADGDGVVGQLPTLAGAWAGRLKNASRRLASDLTFDTAKVEGPTSEQAERESENGRGFLYYAQPTEAAAAAALAETAEIAGRPENRGVLAEIGALYGRLVYLLDSFRDLEDDRKAQRFNPLQASYKTDEIGQRAADFFTTAATRIRELLPSLELRRPEIIERLMVHELAYVGHSTFGPEFLPAGDGVMAMAAAAAGRRRKKRKFCGNDCCCCCCVDIDCCECDGCEFELCECECCGCEICDCECPI